MRKKENKYNLRTGLTIKISSTLTICIVSIFLVVLSVLDSIVTSTLEMGFENSTAEISRQYEAENENVIDFVKGLSYSADSIMVFEIKDEELSIVVTNREFSINKIEKQMLNQLENDGYYYQIKDSIGYYASKVEKINNVYILISRDVSNYYNLINMIELSVLFLILGEILLCIILALIWAKQISKPIADGTISITNIGLKKNVKLMDSPYKEINKLTKTVKKLVDDMEDINKLDKELLANVSHEFKTPLTLIKSYAEMLQDFSGEDKKTRDEHLDIIIHEVDNLTHLVNDILILSRAQAKLDTKASIINLTDLIEKTINRFKTFISNNKLEVEKKLENNIYINANYRQIEEVIYNYLSNAVNFARNTVKIKLISLENCYRFEVEDDGYGIFEKDVDAIWNKYYRGENEPLNNTKGTGLGLAIVKEILSSHNFNYGVITKINEGTIFYFEVPKE